MNPTFHEVSGRRSAGRVLLVDDDPVILAVLKALLGSDGFKVVATGSPVEARSHFEADPNGFKLILSDLRMPELTGVELCSHIRRIDPRQSVIIMSATEQQNSISLEAGCGQVPLLTKPFTPEGLRHCINRVLLSSSSG